MTRSTTSIPATILGLVRMIAGLLVWGSALLFLYAGQTLLCQQFDIASEAGLINPVTALLLGLALAHLALMGLLTWRWFGDSPSNEGLFRHRLEGLILAASVFGLLWLSAPVLMVSPCA